ncbi:porin [Shewanella avicenniae]|uniref:Porin n=1 Tax=Shewanella avicenniae TaxID=2814294 RepID=A0ABX7QND6_9GAMM|nr:porin [Shewanella avicenniae]QSX32967.1 porin [Shewanella avicenniae]
MKTFYTLIAAAVTCSLAQTAAAVEFSYEGITFSPYARVVGGISYVNNGYEAGESGSKFEVASNQWGTSYIGSAVTVDIDEDFKAIANIETGFGTLNGETNNEDSLFNRQANVGVWHKDFGQLSFGTHLALSQDIIDMDPMSFQSMGINTLVNGVNDVFAENSVIYRSPTLYGFELGLMKKFGGEVSDSDRHSGSAASLSYEYEDFKIRAIYQEMTDEFGRYTGGEYYGLGTQGQWLYAKSSTVAASYQLNNAKLMAGYQQVKAPDAGHLLSYVFDDKAEMMWAGVNYAFSKKLVGNAGYYHLNQSFSDKTSNLYTVGVNYLVNNHITFYATVGYVDNNEVDATLVSDVGANNHALSYTEVACNSSGNCNGVSQSGIYTGVVLKL